MFLYKKSDTYILSVFVILTLFRIYLFLFSGGVLRCLPENHFLLQKPLQTQDTNAFRVAEIRMREMQNQISDQRFAHQTRETNSHQRSVFLSRLRQNIPQQSGDDKSY